MKRQPLLLAVLAATALGAAAAEAKPARCYNTDDGGYNCDFRQFGGDGSFTVSAPNRPSYTVSMFGKDRADGFADFGEGRIALPGVFFRSRSDRACWISDATDFEICVY